MLSNATAEPGVSLLAQLRQATHKPHQQLEHTPLMQSLMSAELTQQTYVQVLQTFYRFYAAADPILSQVFTGDQALLTGYQYKPRLPYLTQDLLALEAPLPDAMHSQRTPQKTFSSSSAKPFRLIGLAYVIEGSSQGGRIIAPRVGKKLNINKEYGLAFFSYFSQSAVGWVTLRDQLAQLTVTSNQTKIACAAAESAFSELRVLSQAATQAA